MAFTLSAKSSVCAAPKAARKAGRVNSVVCRAQGGMEVDRRAALSMLAGAATLLSGAAPAFAYGEGANIFGRVTNKTGFVPYSGDNYALLIPAKWLPSKERDFDGVTLRYADNFDNVSNLMLLERQTDKSKIEDYGTPEKFLEQFAFLFGTDSWASPTASEGSFGKNKVSAVSLLDLSTMSDKKGKSYYYYEVLTRAADNDEGGRHHLVKATVSNGKLYILKVQMGDKRWYTGGQFHLAVDSAQSFIVA